MSTLFDRTASHQFEIMKYILYTLHDITVICTSHDDTKTITISVRE